MLTSYARARAEGIGVECKVGVMERPERIVLLAIGLLLGYHVLRIVMTILAAGSMLTFLHRVVHVYRVSHRNSPAGGEAQAHAGATPHTDDTAT